MKVGKRGNQKRARKSRKLLKRYVVSKYSYTQFIALIKDLLWIELSTMKF